MLPYQKYPSIYKYQQDLQQQQQQHQQVPQTPFDMAYGSSLLPRQLLVGSPFIQVQSPLPSPGHHPPGTFQLQRTPGGQQNHLQTFFMQAPTPKLNFPPESARRRGLNYHRTLQRHGSTSSFKNTRTSSNETPSKPKFKSTSSSSSSLNDSTFDNNPLLEQSNPLYSNNGAISSSSSLYNLNQPHFGFNNQYQTNAASIKVSNFQISKQPTRSVLLLSVNQDLTITEFLNSITFGPIENVRIVENYPDDNHNSIVLAFLKIETCLNFYNNILTYLSKFKSTNKSEDLSINFIQTKKPLPFISNAINSDGATRNVYVGNLKSLGSEITEDLLHQKFSKFGIIDKIDLITRENFEEQEGDENTSEADQFAFIHFNNIASAIKAVEQLSLSQEWSNTKIFYGTDRCSINSNGSMIRSITDELDEVLIEQISEEDEDQIHDELDLELQAQQEQEDEAIEKFHRQQQHIYSQQFSNDEDLSTALNQTNLTAQAVATNAGGIYNVGNRTVYLGNLDPKTKPEDICNVVRGGVLQNLKHFPNKGICFITFIEPIAAAQFFANGNIDGITLHGRRLKIGWGKQSGHLPTSVALAVTVGASRNVYIGIKDEDSNNDLKLPNEDELRSDFSKFGEIEQINFFKNDHCVFLNFLNISNAIKVVDDSNGTYSEKFHTYFQNKYQNFIISFGKDRCGNPPKAKKSKNRNRNNRRRQNLQSQEVNGDDVIGHEDQDNNQTVGKLSEDFMNSMGITSKDDNDVKGEEQQHEETNNENVNQDENNAFGITTKDRFNDESKKDGNEGDDELNYSSSSSEALDIIVSSQEPNGPDTPAKLPSEDFKKGSKTSNKKRYNHHQRKKSYSPALSSRVSSASLNSLGYFSYQEQQDPSIYQNIPFAPPPPHLTSNHSFNNLSRGSSRTNLSSYGAGASYFSPQPNHAQGQQGATQFYGNGFSTSGSQVMAQYLAQSQHANMIYAANVLNTTDDSNYEDDNAGFYHQPPPPQFPPQYQGYRRNSNQRNMRSRR